VPSLFVASDDRGEWEPGEADRVARLVRQAQTVVISNARTLIPLERLRELAAAISEFRNRLDAAGT